MTTLYIRLPSQAAAGPAPHWPELPCAFALVTHGKGSQAKATGGETIERQGVMTLPDLSGTIAHAQRVVLLLAAVDVALLHIKVPPLSHARLKAALPNMVEDQLVGDPSGSVVVAGESHEGLRTVAVVQRAWLELLAKTFIELGVRRIAALPAQLCLPGRPDRIAAAINEHGDPRRRVADRRAHPDRIAAAINEHGDAVDATLRLTSHDGIGLTIAPVLNQAEGHPEPPVHDVIGALRAIVPVAPMDLYVPEAEVSAYQRAIDAAGIPDDRLTVSADTWTHWIAGAQSATPDLMAGLGTAALPRQDWRAWRWPLWLILATLLVNITALNLDWWRKKTEANALRASMTRAYMAAYPKETIVIDPIAQMRQKIAAAKRGAGLPSPDDFAVLAATFGEAAASAMPGGAAAAIAAVEYRERSLIVRLKSGVDAPTEKLKTLLAARNLTLEQMPAQNGGVAWQIRSTK